MNLHFILSVKINKCSGSCNNINDLQAKLRVPDTVKSVNVKVFNLMSITNETKHLKWHETCKCRLEMSVFVIKNNIAIQINADPNVKN